MKIAIISSSALLAGTSRLDAKHYLGDDAALAKGAVVVAPGERVTSASKNHRKDVYVVRVTRVYEVAVRDGLVKSVKLA